MNKRLIIIDGNSVLYRAYFALPPMDNGEGLQTNAIYGFTGMLFKMINDYRPSHFCVAFDKSSKTFRHEKFESYKAGRAKMDDELRMQFQPVKNLLDAFKIQRFEIENFEADDIIGTVSKEAENKGYEVLIVSGDKDAIQLVSDKTRVLFTVKGVSQIEEYTPKKVAERYDLTPDQFIDLKALMGDKSDAIPGVPGIGEKTGIKLLKKYNNLEGILENLDQLKGKQRENLENEKDNVINYKWLVTIKRDVDLDFDLDKMVFGNYDREDIFREFKNFKFNTLLKRFVKIDQDFFGGSGDLTDYINDESLVDDSPTKEKISISFGNGDIEQIIAQAVQTKKLYLKVLRNEGNILEKHISKLYFSVDGRELYLIDETDLELVKDILENKNIKKYGYELKADYLALLPYDIKLQGMYFDISIAEYIIDSQSQAAYSFDKIGEKYLGQIFESEEDLLGKGAKKKTFMDIDKAKVDQYHLNILSVVRSIEDYMLREIASSQMDQLFHDIEMPLIEVLGDMEYHGIKADKKILDQLGEEFTKTIENLQNQMYDLAGREFNVNSPKQVGEVFFDELKLPVIQKTKSGYSTKIEVLEKLIDKHPIVEKLIEYRSIAKLNSTYVEGLKALINEKDGRIHSKFNQTITTTGRISSTDPNMQNIPVRTEVGRNLRKVFVSEEGMNLVDADYSQIELRVLAHMSKDENLIEAFDNNEDIHTMTASRVFGVDPKNVDLETRSAAKAINFGIIYGKTDFGLAKDLEITVKEAKEYIDSYFEKYPNIKDFMDGIIAEAEKTGFVETILHRRRHIPEILSKKFMEKNRGIRAAMNAPIQGSAADIIKIAMVNVNKRLKEENLKSRLILQVHDELIIEALEDELQVAKQILREEMENAIDLRVKLDVDLNVGKSWFETK